MLVYCEYKVDENRMRNKLEQFRNKTLKIKVLTAFDEMVGRRKRRRMSGTLHKVFKEDYS